MTTRRLRMLCTSLAPWLASASLLAAPIGQPTPSPCSVDGACTPARATWGYHNTRWRTWPGTQAEDGRAGEQGPLGGEHIGPTAKPDPRSEDKLAPPKVEALDERPAESEAGGSDYELPELPAGSDEAAPPDEERPDRLAPPRPGFMDRPLDEDPFGAPAENGGPAGQPTLPFGQPPAAPVTPQAPADLFPSNMHAPAPASVAGDDGPPPLPFSIHAASQPVQPAASPRGIVLPASAAVSARPGAAPAVMPIPVQTGRSRIERAAAFERSGDAPPHLPQGLFGGR